MSKYIGLLRWLWKEESSFWLDRVMLIISIPFSFIGFVVCEVLPSLVRKVSKRR